MDENNSSDDDNNTDEYLNIADEEYTYDDNDYEYADDSEKYVYSDDDNDKSNKRNDVKDSDAHSDSIKYSNSNNSSAIKTPTSSDSKRSGGKLSISKIAISEGKFQITEYKQIVPMMHSLISEIANLLGIAHDVAQTLLQACRWNKERLIDSYYSSQDKLLLDNGLDLFMPSILWTLKNPDQIFSSPKAEFKSPTSTSRTSRSSTRNSSINSSSSNNSSSNSSSSDSKEIAMNCRICGDEYDAITSFALGCNHSFCRVCYSEYLKTQVEEGPACIRTNCPEYKCKQAVTSSVFKGLLRGETYDKYEVYVVRNFIETSKIMRYCPAAGCDKVAVGSGITTIHCSCSNPFCFRCGDEAHDPCSCAQLAEWLVKCSNESETANWILANTKKCPQCNARIEKNQGCNHMNCKLCKFEFCWICMGSWTDHGQSTGGYYKCNRYDAAKVDSSASAAQKAKVELERYLHYYQRYHGHDQALKYAIKQREDAEARMIQKQEADKSSWIDVQFLKQAAEQVIECRRVLKYTYVLGYFINDNTAEKQLFEYHQEMLEKNTEKLQEHTETLESVDRVQVVNLTRVTASFLQSLLESMTDGNIIDDRAPASPKKSQN